MPDRADRQISECGEDRGEERKPYRGAPGRAGTGIEQNHSRKRQKDQKTKGEARPFLQKEDREDHRKDRGRVIEHDRETEFEFCNRVEMQDQGAEAADAASREFQPFLAPDRNFLAPDPGEYKH